MITGFAYYGITLPDARASVTAASAIFDQLRLTGVDASRYIRTKPDRQDETLHLVETAWDDLTENPSSGNFRFRATAQMGPAEMLGGFDDGTQAGFSLIDLSFVDQREMSEDKIISLFREIARRLHPAYGFCYFCETIEQSISYANVNGATMFAANENPFAFTDDLSEWSGGDDTYKRTRLRMVYPYNLLNNDHLAIRIDGLRLSDWIRDGEERGKIIELDVAAHVWAVPASQLARINRVLGEAGLLISWRPDPAPSRRKLP